MYSVLITLMIKVDPYAFTIKVDSVSKNQDVSYFVLATLSTLGIGDIIPLKSHAKSLTVLISISGQLYLAVIITLLVGKYSRRLEQKHNNANQG
jgi:voltage-gated potassium channel